MVEIPKSDSNLNVIMNVGQDESPQTPSRFIPYSAIGNKCGRAIQYSWHWASSGFINKRTKRIFDLGNALEAMIVADLEAHGMIVTRQQENVFGFAGVWKGKIDGVITKVPGAPVVEHLLEIKTMNDKNFKAIVKEGLKKSKPGYYAQIQSYMKKLNLTRALLVCYNKNDSSYYLERIKADYEYQEELSHKETIIATSESLLPKIGNGSPSWYECKFCNNWGVCWGEVEINHNCRTCEHSDVHNDNRWHCNFHGKDLDYDEQAKGCSHFKTSEMFYAPKWDRG